MFDELMQESDALVARTNKVKTRMENVRGHIEQYQQVVEISTDISQLAQNPFQSDRYARHVISQS